MAEEIGARFRRLRWLVTKIETYHKQVDEMMVTEIEDGLGAMRYGQYGGSFPDPTARTVFDASGDPRTAVKWRDHRPEDDRKAYWAAITTAEKALEEADTIRQRHMSANNEIRNRLDPTDWCVIQYALRIYEGHRRTKGNLCGICAKFYGENGREPTLTEADFYHRHGRWPHKLVDPKERRAV